MLSTLRPVLAIADASTTAAATTTGLIDTRPDSSGNLGYHALHLCIEQTSSNSTSNKLSVCKIEESDTSNGSMSAIVSLTGGTATSTSVGFVIPNAHTANTQQYLFNIDLRGRKRWLKISLSPATTQTLRAYGMLARGEQNPPPTAAGGLALIVG